MKKILFLILILLSQIGLYASRCRISYERVACKGFENSSYLKCGGKQKCVVPQRVENINECIERAYASCSNSRIHVTKKKIITATYNEKELLSNEGTKDFCQNYKYKKLEYGQCE